VVNLDENDRITQGSQVPHNADGSNPDITFPPTLHTARPDETTLVDEVSMQRGWLAYLRAGAIFKLDGLDGDQLRWQPAPTANSLGGIVTHLGYAERLWVRTVFAGERMDMSWTQDRYAPTFVVPGEWTTTEVIDFYRSETEAADLVLNEAVGPEERSRSDIRPTTLRWVLAHLVEEVARHLGHMDITRELLDGRTGR
jgi:uncharacterized damage-inducible protein DinB